MRFAFYGITVHGVDWSRPAGQESGGRDPVPTARPVERIEVGWKGLVRVLLLFVLALGVSAAMIGSAHHYRGAREARLGEAGQTLRESRNRFRFIDDEKRLIEDLLPRYRALEAEGVIGSEARLDWVEALRAASRRLGLPELRYALGAQERLPADPDAEGAGFGVYRSLMDLQLGLLREEDLVRLFEVMERESPGLFSVSSCRVRRAGSHFVRLPAAVNLRATCTLEWFSLHQEGAEQ